MKKYLLIQDYNGEYVILDTIICITKEEAEYYFASEEWNTGEIIEQEEFISLKLKEKELFSLS